MTKAEVDQALVEMSMTRGDVVEEILMEDIEPYILDDDLSIYELDDLIEELEEDSGLVFNI